MEGCNWKMRSIIVLVITNLLPLAMTVYEDLGHLCLEGIKDKEYKAIQPIISYNATPYPFVTNDTNITLTCSGRSVDFISNPEDQGFMTNVELYKNDDELLRNCKEESFSRLRSLSCNVTVTGVANNDKFMCIIRASYSPCNAAQFSFQVESPVAPNVSRLFPTLNYDGRKLEITCNGTGIPEPNVAWLLNGSMINYTSIEKTINAVVDTKLADLQNGTNSYRVNSKIVITDRKFPLHIQCVVKNEIDEVYSENVYALYVAIINVKLTTATVRWLGHPHMNTNFLTVSGYNVSLKCGNEYNETIRLYNKSSVTLRNLTMGRAYTVKIQALNKIGDLAIGAAWFYSPASRKAVVGWESISANTTIHGVLLGYKVILIGKYRKMNITLASDGNNVVLPYLIRKSEYIITIRGFTQFGEGRILEYNFTTLDVIPAPKNLKVTNILANFAVVQWTVIEQQEEKYDRVTGYTVTVRNETHFFNIKTSSNSSSVSINHLLPNTSYRVSVVGLSEETEGMPSEWISFKTNLTQNLLAQRPFSDQGESNETKGESSSTLTIVILPVAIILGTIIVLTAFALIQLRRRNMKKSQNIEPNQIVMDNAMRSVDNNLRILYPEYYNADASNDPEDLPSWEINRARLAVLDNILGGGYFGVVKEGVFMQSLSGDHENQKIPVAVKTLKANRGQSDWNELLREFEILQHVNSTGHKNIIKLIGACTQTVPILLVMEFCSRGNLKDFLRESRVNEEPHKEYNNIYSKLTERQLINFAAEVARGMKFLFEKKVVHRDIASRNILLNDQLVPKIADFGLARKIDVAAHYIVTKNRMLPVKWMSIESLEMGRFTPASDTWSYGVLLWEICTLAEEPYADVSPYDILDYLHEGHRMNRPEHCSIEIFSLMERCWLHNLEERPSFNEIYNSLENMLTNNERTYINMKPYHDVIETMMSKSEDFFQEVPRKSADSDLSEAEENCSRDSGVFDTAF